MIGDDAAEVEEIEYPRAEMLRSQFSEQPIPVYSGEAAIRVRFRTPRTRPPKLTLTYQACDETACLPPVTLNIEPAAGNE